MIQLIFCTGKYKNLLKNMWKQCFPMDSDKYIDFYFDKIYKKNETLLLTKKSEPIASMQLLPYSLKAMKRIYRVGYVSGLMTFPSYRNKGYMKTLLTASFDVMRNKGFDYTFLIPQKNELICVYEKFGYQIINSPLFYCLESKSYRLNISCKVYSYFHPECEEWYSIYSRFLFQQPYTILKTKERFKHVLWSFFHEKGNLFVNKDGIAFTIDGDEKIIIKEFFYRNDNVKNFFLTTIRDYYKQKNIEFALPSTVMIRKLYPSAQTFPYLYVNMMLD